MTCFTEVLEHIAPRQTDAFAFIGDSLMPQQRIFGGQVVAQCLMAANQTVESELNAHSLHAYFLRAGDPSIPIEVLKMASPFCRATTRRVEKDRPSRIGSTSKSIGLDGSPARRK